MNGGGVVMCGMYGLCATIRIRKKLLDGIIPTRVLTVSYQIDLGQMLVKNLTVYATMQPGLQLAALSMGAEVVGSASGAFEAIVKSTAMSAKESIGVCICGWRDAMNLFKAERLLQALFLYLIGLRTYGKIVDADVKITRDAHLRQLGRRPTSGR